MFSRTLLGAAAAATLLFCANAQAQLFRPCLASDGVRTPTEPPLPLIRVLPSERMVARVPSWCQA
jgi:hypothetical protein